MPPPKKKQELSLAHSLFKFRLAHLHSNGVTVHKCIAQKRKILNYVIVFIILFHFRFVCKLVQPSCWIGRERHT